VLLGMAMLVAACPARGAEAPAENVRDDVKMLRRLEQAASEYTGPNAWKLLDATVLESVRLYEGAKYDPALDSILLAWAMYPAGVPRTYYGLQPGGAEVAVRWPSAEDAGLLPLDAKKYLWVMVAVANQSGVRIEIPGLRARVLYDGMPVKDAAGKPVVSLGPDDPELRKLLGAKAAVLTPGAVNQGETVTFPMVFPAFSRWNEIRFVDDANKIDVPVSDHAAMGRNLNRVLAARKLAEARRAKLAEIAKAAQPATRPGSAAKPAERALPPYILIGYIQNRVQGTQYGIHLIEPALAREQAAFLIRRNDTTLAELRPLGSGSIAVLLTPNFTPKPGDPVYVKRQEK